MARRELSPRSVGHVLDDAISLYRANFKTIVSAVFAVVFPFALFYGLTQTFYVRGMFDMIAGTIASGPGAEPPDLPPIVAIAYALSSVASLAYALSQRYFEGSVLRSGPAFMTTRPPRLKAMLSDGLRAFPSVLGVSILSSIAVGTLIGLSFAVSFVGVLLASAAAVASGGNPWVIVGLVLTVPISLVGLAAGLAVSVYFSVAVPAVAVEGCGVFTAFRRSATLVRRNFWRVVLIYMGAFVLVMQMEGALTSPSVVRDVVIALQHPDTIFTQLSVGWKVFEGLVGAGALVMVIPVYYFTWLATYLDLRARNEGLDLIVRAQELAAERA